MQKHGGANSAHEFRKKYVCGRVLQPPHNFRNFVVTTSTLAQVGGFAQKPFWSSFVKIC